MQIHGARYLHILVPCPLGWGSASCDTIKVARLAKETGLFPVFEAEHGVVTASRRSATARSRSTSRSRVVTPPLRRARPARHRRADPSRSPTRTSRATGSSSDADAAGRDAGKVSVMTEAPLRDHPRGRVEPREPHRFVARRAARLRRSTAPRATTPAPPGRTSSSGSTTPSPATTRPRGANSSWTIPSRRHGTHLLSPVRDRVQPRPGRRGGRDQRHRTLPRATSPSSAAGRCPRPARHRQARPRRRRRPVGLSAAYHLRRLGHQVHSSTRASNWAA
jgi:hypothetical protein